MNLEGKGDCLTELLLNLCFFGLIIFASQFQLPIYALLAITVITAFGFGFLYRKLRYDWAQKRNTIGTIAFDENCISIAEPNGSFQLAYLDLSTMNLVSSFFEGYQPHSKEIVYDGLASVLFTNKIGKKYTFKFVVKDKDEYDNFREIMKAIYKSHVEVKEKLAAGAKTILLEPNVPFAKIQALKKELGVDNF
jgi:hypothetical protein